jgi:pyridoxal phosphate enzyme (YggS family)
VAPPAHALTDPERQALAARLRDVRARLEAACSEVSLAEVPLLLAVSKGQPPAAIRAAYELGQRDFGENYVQELVEKAEALRDLPELRFHVIGHLQRNKVKHVAAHAQAVHSVDSLLLLAELDRRMAGREIASERRAFGADPRLPVLVEVSIAGEAQKGGCVPAELGALLDAADSASALRLVGLMCVPPLDAEPAQSRKYFDALRQLRDAHGGARRLPELSMGMTQDFEHAIRAGSTVVRVGTAIFGPRQPRAGAA